MKKNLNPLILLLFSGILLVAMVTTLQAAPQAPRLTPSPAPSPSPSPSPAPSPSGPVTLTVTAQPSYALGQQVILNLALVNQGSGAVGLSRLIAGNIQVTSFQRDGLSVPPLPTEVVFDEDLATALALSLQAVGPGASLATTWESQPDQNLNGHGLQMVQLSSQPQALVYGINVPGTYTITLVYHYAGPTGTFPGAVYTGVTNPATVTFTVH